MEKKIQFESYDGTNLIGMWEKPLEEVKGIFLLVHGLPSDKDEWGFYRDMAEKLSSYGYASLRFDLRSNGESQSRPLVELTMAQLINDIDAAYYQISELHSEAVPRYIVGTSCGGGLTIKWLNTFDREISRVFLMAPVLDYEYEVFGKKRVQDFNVFRRLLPEYRNRLKQYSFFEGDIPYGIQFLNEARLFQAEKELDLIKCSVLIIQGKEDSVVPIEITKDYLRHVKKKINLIEIAGADHGFAAEGDDDLISEETKKNHAYVYDIIIKEIGNDNTGTTS